MRTARSSIPQTPHRVIYKLRELLGVDEMGGTMRLGAWPCRLQPGSFAHRAYGTLEISERHRHRYEFNRDYEKNLIAAGLQNYRQDARRDVCGDCRGAPIIPGSWAASFIRSSSPSRLEPHPLFAAFIGASQEHRERRAGRTGGDAVSEGGRGEAVPARGSTHAESPESSAAATAAFSATTSTSGGASGNAPRR